MSKGSVYLLFSTIKVVFIVFMVLLFSISSRVYADESEEYYDDYSNNSCRYCRTNGVFLGGTLYVYLRAVHGSRVGYGVYSSNLDVVEEVSIEFTVGIGNETIVSIWLTSNDTVGILNNVNWYIDLNRVMVGTGVGITVTKSSWSVLVADESGLSNATVIAGGDLENVKPVAKYRSHVVYNFKMVYGKAFGSLAYLVILSANTVVYDSLSMGGMIRLYEPRYVSFVSNSLTNPPFNQSFSFLDYVKIVFLRESTRKLPPIVVNIGVPVDVYGLSLWRVNSSHVCVSYLCHFISDASECSWVHVTIYRDNVTIYENNLTLDKMSVIQELRVVLFREYVYVGEESVNAKICGHSNACETVVIPSLKRLLETNPYTRIIAILLPLAIIVSLGVRYEMKEVGIGLISSGVIIVLLPLLNILGNEGYGLGVVMITLGIIVLYLYRT